MVCLGSRERISITIGGILIKLEGEEGIRQLGHREYVGGLWGELGRLQLDFMVDQGLLPSHCFLDVGCGALRGGVLFISYLDPGNYLGIDKEPGLIRAGIEHELGREVYELKRPELVVSAAFEFESFSRKPRFSLAQSLFTHFNQQDLGLCLTRLRSFVEPGHTHFATFFEGDSSDNPARSHSHLGFRYSVKEMEGFGVRSGWRPTYLGDWSHPRHQVMMRFEAA